MNWDAGSQHNWPEVAFRLIEGDLLLLSSGTNDFGLTRLERGRLYPGVVLSSTASVCLKLQAIGASRLEWCLTEIFMRDCSGWQRRSVKISVFPYLAPPALSSCFTS